MDIQGRSNSSRGHGECELIGNAAQGIGHITENDSDSCLPPVEESDDSDHEFIVTGLKIASDSRNSSLAQAQADTYNARWSERAGLSTRESPSAHSRAYDFQQEDSPHARGLAPPRVSSEIFPVPPPQTTASPFASGEVQRSVSPDPRQRGTHTPPKIGRSFNIFSPESSGLLLGSAETSPERAERAARQIPARLDGGPPRAEQRRPSADREDSDRPQPLEGPLISLEKKKKAAADRRRSVEDSLLGISSGGSLPLRLKPRGHRAAPGSARPSIDKPLRINVDLGAMASADLKPNQHLAGTIVRKRFRLPWKLILAFGIVSSFGLLVGLATFGIGVRNALRLRGPKANSQIEPLRADLDALRVALLSAIAGNKTTPSGPDGP